VGGGIENNRGIRRDVRRNSLYLKKRCCKGRVGKKDKPTNNEEKNRKFGE